MKDDKELSDLEVCIAIAELKGFTAKVFNDVPHIKDGLVSSSMSSSGSYMSHKIFNPIIDNALNLELRDEFEVDVRYPKFSYECGVVSMGHGENQVFSQFTDKSQINRAVCLCILESVK